MSKGRAAQLACAALAALMLLPPLPASALSGINLCNAVTPKDVAALIGETPAPPISTGPAADDDHAGAIATSCRFEGKTRIFALMLLDFGAVGEASAALQHDTAAVKASGDAKMDPLTGTGLGEEVYLATDPSSATYVSRKGQRLIAIGISGENSGTPDLHARLLKLAQSAIAHLPPIAAKPLPQAN